MQTKRRFKLNPVIVGTIVFLIVVIFAVSGKRGHGDSVQIGNTGEYNQVLREAEATSKEALEKLSNDEPLTPHDRDNLSKAASLFESLIRYQPAFGPLLAQGMIYRGLNDPAYAQKMLDLCIQNIPVTKNPDIIASSAEAHYQLSRALFDQHNYENALAEASTAIQTVPNNPNYLTARAAAYMQLKRYVEAKADLDEALKLMPEHKRAGSLKKLLH